jgi:hypothetical protein
MTPGISPFRLKDLKQIRHIANLRKYPLGRPQTLQRWYRLTKNLGLRCAFAIKDFFATLFPHSNRFAEKPSVSTGCSKSSRPSLPAGTAKHMDFFSSLLMNPEGNT